ncbi:MAG TPA: thioesterase family protein [Pseudonocardiaceae bacterium]|jgi:acyl-CoA thioester hydrolase|nr:thioesterase family protein [Pseudonocardiaceae bacterium]
MPAEAVFSATIERRIEWYDTDAAGHQHYSVIFRLVDSAEAELLRANGLDWLFGKTPRVRHEVDYRNRLWFGDLATARVELAELGRTSMRLTFEVCGPNGQVAATGTVVTVYAPPDAAASTPWPDSVREVFAHR